MNQEITSTAPSRQPGRGRVVATALGLGAALGVPVMWAANLGAAPSQADPDTTDVVTSDTGVEPPSTGEVTPTTGEITETTNGTWVTIEIAPPIVLRHVPAFARWWRARRGRPRRGECRWRG